MITPITVGNLFKNNDDAIKKIQGLSNSIGINSKIFEFHNEFGIVDAIDKINMLKINSFPQIIDLMDRLQPIIKSLNSVHFALDQSLGDYIENLRKSNSENIITKRLDLDSVLNQIDDEVAATKLSSNLSIDVKLSIIFFIIQIILSMIQNVDSEKEQMVLIAKLEQINRTVNEISKLKGDSVEIKEYYYAKHQSKIRISPKTKSLVIGTIKKGSIVQKIKIKNKWIKVHCINRNGTEAVGWIMKKYFIKIE